MGTRKSDYIIVGIDIGKYFIKYFDYEEIEEFDEYSDRAKNGEIMYLIDHESEKYFIIGEIIKRDIDGFQGIGFNEINLDALITDDRKNRIQEYVKSKFNIENEVKLYVLTHWS